jgi:hypothetical protein
LVRAVYVLSSLQLPDAELSDAGLKISPLDSNVPKEADALREDVYGLLPHVKITDLLLEVNRWTDFTRYFVHLKTGEPAMLVKLSPIR